MNGLQQIIGQQVVGATSANVPHSVANDLDQSRRQFLSSAARGFLGVSFFGLAGETILGTPAALAAAGNGKAKQVIYLFMNGAMSHLDTFDPKPGTDSQGDTQPIATSIPGVKFGDKFAKMAKLADRLAVVRSLSTETGAHEQGRYLMRTAYPALNSIRHPALGSWMLNSGVKGPEDLPGNILIGSDNDHPMNGFLPPGLAPVPVADPDLGLQNVTRPSYLGERDFNTRMALINKFDRKFRSAYQSTEIEAYNQMYKDAIRLMGSEKLVAFDLNAESEEMRDRYGRNKFGQGCLLARRLIEEKVPFVEVNYGNWDMHNDLQTRLDEHGSNLDQGFAALVEDLESRGLLSTTLIVLATEFGRTPKINENAGRDHHPGAFSCLLAGAGIHAGQVYGSSDKAGFSVAEDGVSVAEFNSTIAAAIGLSTKEEFIAPNGRPFKIANGADPISKLLA
jgi:hypothetical protein